MVYHYADLAGELGAIVYDTKPILVHAAEDEASWRSRRREFGDDPDSPYAILNPGASFGSSKVWTTERFASVAQTLVKDRGFDVYVSVGPSEEDLAKEIDAHAEVPVRPLIDPILNLHELKPAVAGASLLVTTDTGTRQYGSAYSIPTVVVFGPTDERYTMNQLERSRLVRHPLDCAPCHRKTCPLEDHLCMKGLEVEPVLEAVDELLGAAP